MAVGILKVALDRLHEPPIGADDIDFDSPLMRLAAGGRT